MLSMRHAAETAQLHSAPLSAVMHALMQLCMHVYPQCTGILAIFAVRSYMQYSGLQRETMILFRDRQIII